MNQHKFEYAGGGSGPLEGVDFDGIPDFEIGGFPVLGAETLFDNVSESMDLSTETTQTPRLAGSTASGSLMSKGYSGASSSESQWPFGAVASNLNLQQQAQLINPLQGVGALGGTVNLEQALAINIVRSESEIRKISSERDQLRNDFLTVQGRLKQILAEKSGLEGKVKELENLVRTMGQTAFQQALHHLKLAFDAAPIPRGIRFAPTDYEVLEYLARKLRGAQEDVGLDKFLVRRLRGMQDSDSLIPEVELLKYPRPWHLPGLDVAPDGKGQVGFYYVRPEWRPNERRRRREADMAPNDPKPPCWKESCQPTMFEDLVAEYGGRPERRMFRFKLPGAREGPAGEKEKWKMYEYTLKSDAEMFDDRRNGMPVWVICKVIREGPMTAEEQEERNRVLMGRGGGPSGGDGGFPPNFFEPGSQGPGGNGKMGKYDSPSNSGGGNSQGGSGMAGGGGFGGFSGGMQYRTHTGGQEGSEKQQPAGTSGSAEDRTGGSTGGSPTTTQGTTTGALPRPGARSQSGSTLTEWLKTVPVPPRPQNRHSGSWGSEGSSPPRSDSGSHSLASGVGSPPLGDSSWLATLPDVNKVAALLLEDFFVSKLVVKVRGSQVAEGGRTGLSPPSWSRALPEEYWEDVEDEDEADVEDLPEEDDEEAEEELLEETEEDERRSFRPAAGSSLDNLACQLLSEVRELKDSLQSASVVTTISGRVLKHLTQMEALLTEFLEHAGRDEPAALLWLECLQEGLAKLRALASEISGKDSQSRILLFVKSPEMAEEAQVAVRRLAHVLSLLPHVHLDAMSPTMKRKLEDLKGDMATAEFASDGKVSEAVSKLQAALKEWQLADEKGVLQQKDGFYGGDEVSQAKALNQVKDLMLGFGTKTSSVPLLPSSGMNNLMVEVFALVGVEWDSSAVSVELDKLQMSKGAKKEKAEKAAKAGREDEDSALADGLIALLQACSSEGTSDPSFGPLDGEDDWVETSGKKEKELDFSPVPDVSLHYSCLNFTGSEVDGLVESGARIGKEVVRATWNGRHVVVHQLKEALKPEPKFHQEIERLTKVDHANVVKMVGCSFEKACVVFEDSASSSLADYFGGPESLDSSSLKWYTRVQILCQVAETLADLHSMPEPVVHTNISLETILLNRRGRPQITWWPTPIASKLYGVGLRNLMPYEADNNPTDTYRDPCSSTSTKAYVPASDVYSFGLVAMTLLSGKVKVAAMMAFEKFDPVVRSKRKGEESPKVKDVLDREAGWPEDDAKEVVELAMRCVNNVREERPTFKEGVLPVLRQLMQKGKQQEDADVGGAISTLG